MAEEKRLNILELVGGLLVTILGGTNAIQMFFVGAADLKAFFLFSVYGSLFLFGGFAFFLAVGLQKLGFKRLIINVASILLLMCAISNYIYLITLGGSAYIVVQGLSVVNIILCVSSLPMTFFRYAALENMDSREKLSFLSLVLLRGSGLFHLLQPFIYEPRFETDVMFLFGVMYLLIAFLLTRHKASKLAQQLGLLLPLVGGILGIGLLVLYPTPYVIVFIIFDVIIVVIRIYYLRTQSKV